MTSLGGNCCLSRTYSSEKYVISSKSLRNSDAGVALLKSLGISVIHLLNVTMRVPLSLISTFFFPLGTAGGSEGDSGLSEGHGGAACCQRDHFAR